jgi:hypothetical protein
MGATQNGDSNRINVFLEGGRSYHLRSLTQSRVDDFHPRISECAGDHFRTSIVTIKTRLGY